MKRIGIILCLVFLAILPAPAAPATAPTQYDIEVLVFENRLPNLEGGELWVREPKAPANLGEAAAAGDVPEAETMLTQAVEQLAGDGRYRVLARKRWRQTAEAKSASAPVRISSANAELDGTLRFYLSRFLHVELNLVLQEGKGGNPAGQAYALDEHRRVRPQEIHYFDHPKFGVLVRVVSAGKS